MLGGLLVVPRGLVDTMAGRAAPPPVDTQASAARARALVMATERRLGFEPTDREFDKLGYDIESRVPATGQLRFIEVKGRRSDAATLTVTRNEILYSLNKPDDFILAIVEFRDDDAHRVHYVDVRFSANRISPPRASTTRCRTCWPERRPRGRRRRATHTGLI